MSDERTCRFCERADCKRTKDNLIRCVFHHDWTSPDDHCKDYSDPDTRFFMEKVRAGERMFENLVECKQKVKKTLVK